MSAKMPIVIRTLSNLSHHKPRRLQAPAVMGSDGRKMGLWLIGLLQRLPYLLKYEFLKVWSF